MQDLLPAFVAGTLEPPDRAAVEAHVAACAPCAEDVALLRRVREWRVPAPTVDAARIAAAVRAAHPRMRRDADSRPAPVPGRSAPARAPWHRWQGGPLRAAAALVLVVGAGMVVQRTLAVGEGPRSVADTVVASAGPVAMAGAEGAVSQVAVSYGDLGEYTAEEMDAVLARLERWDGAPSTEPLGTLPVLDAAGGDRR